MSCNCLGILQGVVLEDGDKCTLFSECHHLPAILLRGEGQTWEVKPNTLYQKAWIYMTATEQRWAEMCSQQRLLPKIRNVLALSSVVLLPGRDAGTVSVGLEFGSFVT